MTSGCDSSPEQDPQSLPSATVPSGSAEAPDGWQTREGPGFSVAVPPTWQNRPEDQRAAKAAALEVGVPYTGQRTPPPLLLAFVERELVGPLPVREQVLRAQLRSRLPGDATIGDSEHVAVAGATDAVYFDVTYRTAGGTSVLDTPLEPTLVRQRELVVETPGLPKYGLRYSAAQADFDEDVWAGIVRSLRVRAGSGSTGTGGDA